MSEHVGSDHVDGVVDLDGGFVVVPAEHPVEDLTHRLTPGAGWAGYADGRGLVVVGPDGWRGRVELSLMSQGGLPEPYQERQREHGLTPTTEVVLDSAGSLQVRRLDGPVIAELRTVVGRVEVAGGFADREEWQPQRLAGSVWLSAWSREERDRVRFDGTGDADGDDPGDPDDDEDLTEEELAEIAAFAERAQARFEAERAARRPEPQDPRPSWAELGLDPDQAGDAEEVISQLDEVAARHGFADVGHPYSYAVDARLHAYADAGRWALVVETLGYNPRGGNLFDEVHVYGNCLTEGEPGIQDPDFRPRVDNIEQVEGAPETYAGSVPVRVRGRDLAVVAQPGTDLVDLFRSLVPEHRDLLLADEAELRARVPADLPEVLRLEEWHQPDLLETRPGRSQAYRLLAAVLVTADPAYYRPTEEPNTHWENWPESGSL